MYIYIHIYTYMYIHIDIKYIKHYQTIYNYALCAYFHWSNHNSRLLFQNVKTLTSKMSSVASLQTVDEN